MIEESSLCLPGEYLCMCGGAKPPSRPCERDFSLRKVLGPSQIDTLGGICAVPECVSIRGLVQSEFDVGGCNVSLYRLTFDLRM